MPTSKIATTAENAPTYNFGIESLQSHQFSVGIFIFMMIGIVFFAAIVIVYIKKGAGEQRIKRGEWAMLGAIFLGLIAAAVMAALQLLEGYLF